MENIATLETKVTIRISIWVQQDLMAFLVKVSLEFSIAKETFKIVRALIVEVEVILVAVEKGF